MEIGEYQNRIAMFSRSYGARIGNCLGSCEPTKLLVLGLRFVLNLKFFLFIFLALIYLIILDPNTAGLGSPSMGNPLHRCTTLAIR